MTDQQREEIIRLRGLDSDITVTLDTYTHLGLEDAAEELKRLAEVEQARKEQEKLNQNGDDDEAGAIVAI